MNYKYKMEVFWQPEDECYYAIVPDIKEFRYISAWGDTPEKAIKELQVCISIVIEDLIERGDDIPKPNFERVS